MLKPTSTILPWKTINCIKSNYLIAGVITDSYMKLMYSFAYFGDGNYRVTTEAKWLVMPFFRGKDAIGSCVQFLTVTPGSEEGYYTFDYTCTTQFETTHGSGKLDITDIQTASDGNFYGAAGLYFLPNDSAVETVSVIYKNLFAHFSYRGHMNFPDTRTWFNANGTYIHTTVGLSIAPSLKIDGSGANASIGLSVIAYPEKRTVPLELLYQP